jgi:hypothetical protein
MLGTRHDNKKPRLKVRIFVVFKPKRIFEALLVAFNQVNLVVGCVQA